MTSQLSLFTGRRRTRRPRPATEFAVHCAVADTLRRFANPDWYWTHIPSGEDRTAVTGARLKRMGLKTGLPDLMLIAPAGRVFFLEIKRARLGRVTADQDFFISEMVKRGIPCAVTCGYDETIAQLNAWGALKPGVKVAA